MYVVPSMRASLILLILCTACTVVPTPTSSGAVVGNPNLVGTWKAVGLYNSDTLVHRLAIFSDGSYERGAVDSSPATGKRLVLSEIGVWTLATDTTRIVFSPYSRLIWSPTGAALGPAATTPVTGKWSRSADTLYITLPLWYQPDTTAAENLAFGRD